jgi:UDP-GlcNAc:undecaprenyl-phosphate GlcNAc-1-phosphate transferase
MSTVMSNGLGKGLLGLGLAFLVAAALVPLGIRLAWRFGVVDYPVGNKIHARPTPLMGGAAMAASFLMVTALFPRHWPNQALVGLLVGCALATALGIADEMWSLSPWKHFVGQVGVVLVAIAIGFPVIQRVSNPFAPVSLRGSSSVYLATLLGFGPAPWGLAHAITLAAGVLFTVFWIVGMMNTVNFLDGLDGLAGGVGAIAALFLGLWAWRITGSGYAPTRDEQNVILPLILCGAILGFLLFNWAPARVFMGDSGAMFVGFALGALSIFGPVKLGTALLILIVPIVDVAWAIVRRLLGRRSFASGDKHHIYHRMLELGLPRRAVVLAFYALCTALGVLDLLLVKQQKLAAFAVVAVLAAAGAVALEVRGRRAEARAGRPGADYHLPTLRR